MDYIQQIILFALSSLLLQSFVFSPICYARSVSVMPTVPEESLMSDAAASQWSTKPRKRPSFVRRIKIGLQKMPWRSMFRKLYMKHGQELKEGMIAYAGNSAKMNKHSPKMQKLLKVAARFFDKYGDQWFEKMAKKAF